MSELKPCPFCGGEADLRKDFGTQIYYVVCNNSGCNHAGYDTPEIAATAWNTRTDPEKDRLQQENQQLKELLRLAVGDMKIAKPCCICKNKDLCYGNCFSYDGFKWQHDERID